MPRPHRSVQGRLFFCRFVDLREDVDLGDYRVPLHESLKSFRRFLRHQGLTNLLFRRLQALLDRAEIAIGKGCIVDDGISAVRRT